MPGCSAGLWGHRSEEHKCFPCSHVLCSLEQSQTGEHGWIPEDSLTCQETKILKPFEGKATGPEIDEPVSPPPQTVPDLLLQPSLLGGMGSSSRLEVGVVLFSILFLYPL